MKNPIPLLLLLLVGWIAGLAFYTRQSCGDCTSPLGLSTTAAPNSQNLTKKYLSDNNINEAQIVPAGKGSKSPIADTALEGRAKNSAR